MKHAFDVRVSQRDAEIALRRFLFRSEGWGTILACALCFGFVVFDVSDGSLGRLGFANLTLLLILALFYLVAFVTRRNQMTDLMRKLGDTPVSYSLSDSEIGTRSALGSSTLKWELIRKLWIDPDITMVFYARNGYTTIPTNQIPADAMGFLAAQVKRVGGLVLDNRTKVGQAGEG